MENFIIKYSAKFRLYHRYCLISSACCLCTSGSFPLYILSRLVKNFVRTLLTVPGNIPLKGLLQNLLTFV